jgi:protein-arginine kinase activator protein McsA
MADDQLRDEVENLKREIAELRKRFEDHLKNPVYENPAQIRPSAREKAGG